MNDIDRKKTIYLQDDQLMGSIFYDRMKEVPLEFYYKREVEQVNSPKERSGRKRNPTGKYEAI